MQQAGEEDAALYSEEGWHPPGTAPQRLWWNVPIKARQHMERIVGDIAKYTVVQV